MDDEVYEKVEAAEETLWFYVGRRRIIQNLVQHYVGALAAKHLDVGCGAGNMLQALRQHSRFSVGVDSAYKALQLSKKDGVHIVAQADALSLCFPDHTFDFVTVLDVLEHCEDDLLSLAEVYRVLKPGGIVVLTVPALSILWSALDRTAHHYRRYTASELRKKAQQSDFVVLKVSYANFFLFPFVFIGRMLERLLDISLGLDFNIPSAFVNRLLTGVFSREAGWIMRRTFPVGSSVVAVLQKPASGKGIV
ncbi:MAG: class I SAM-dependent methyltransferase [Anaerolineae bacterium]|nr:class I SAM-dependent methyltransferase [Anaerolineae bacterium]